MCVVCVMSFVPPAIRLSLVRLCCVYIIRSSRCGVLVSWFAAALFIGVFDFRRHLSFFMSPCVSERCCVGGIILLYHGCVVERHSPGILHLCHWCMRGHMLLLLRQSTLG